MKKVKKIVNYISWIIIVLMGIMLIINWSKIPSTVITHSGLGRISYGDKITLMVLLVIVIIVNTVFTLGYDVPFIKELKKTIQHPIIIDIATILIQILVILISGAFIILAIK